MANKTVETQERAKESVKTKMENENVRLPKWEEVLKYRIDNWDECHEECDESLEYYKAEYEEFKRLYCDLEVLELVLIWYLRCFSSKGTLYALAKKACDCCIAERKAIDLKVEMLSMIGEKKEMEKES